MDPSRPGRGRLPARLSRGQPSEELAGHAVEPPGRRRQRRGSPNPPEVEMRAVMKVSELEDAIGPEPRGSHRGAEIGIDRPDSVEFGQPPAEADPPPRLIKPEAR